jgi:hypothetical protein
MRMDQHELIPLTDDLSMEVRNRWAVDYDGVRGIPANVEHLTIWDKRINTLILVSIDADFEPGTIDLTA